MFITEDQPIFLLETLIRIKELKTLTPETQHFKIKYFNVIINYEWSRTEQVEYSINLQSSFNNNAIIIITVEIIEHLTAECLVQVK